MRSLLLLMLLSGCLLASQGPGATRILGSKVLQVRFPEVAETLKENEFDVNMNVAIGPEGKIIDHDVMLDGERIQINAMPADYPLWKKDMILAIAKAHENFLFTPITDEHGNKMDKTWFSLGYKFRKNTKGNTQIKILMDFAVIACDTPYFSD